MIINTQIAKKGDIFPTPVSRCEKDKSDFYFYTDNNVVFKVSVLRDGLLRFRYTTKGFFNEDFSYAVDLEQPRGYNGLEFSEKETCYEIKTSKVVCRVEKQDLRTSIFDLEGKCILEDELGFHWEENYEFGGNVVKMTKVSQPSENFYGLGDKPSQFNLKGKRVHNWATDQYAFSKDQDPLYKAIPFYVALHSNISYGIFFDNTFKTYFDFSSERKSVSSFWADGGEMNYYFIYGPSVRNVVISYTELTGKPEMPPMWALGYQQSKWSYSTETVLKDIASKFRKLQIPCDVLHLDIDYMDGFRCFTWNKNSFPDPKAMVKDLNADGFKVVVIIDPGIKSDKDYYVYEDGLKNDVFCRRADGAYMYGKVWPGGCCFPDFTSPKVREWWSNLYKELISDIGISGVWSDMNEPAVMEVPNKTFPNDVRHDYDGYPCSHRKAHNIYGMQMAKATYEGVKKFSAPHRPLCITRSAYAGTQRYTSTWTGDSVASWEHLWIANIQMQRLSISGYSFCGSDIGGFAERPTSELFARWIQLGSFHPFFRTHSSGQHGEQEPWSFGKEVMGVVKKFIELRYQLLPYLYTAFWHYTKEGIPIMKPLVLFDQKDVQTHHRNDEWVYGEHILICPILEPNSVGRRMYLPKGRWYNFWNNDELIEGREEVWVDARLDKMPIFVLEGSIIPRYPVQQYVDEKKFEAIYLDAYYKNGKESSDLYEDGHDGYDYLKGDYLYSSFKLVGKPSELVITQYQEGNYKVFYQHFILKLIGLPFKIKKIEIDDEDVLISEIINGHPDEIKIPQTFSQVRIYGDAIEAPQSEAAQ